MLGLRSLAFCALALIAAPAAAHAGHEHATGWTLNPVLIVPLGLPLLIYAVGWRRLEDVDENCLYWRYVWLMWLPIYLLIYWVPRL